MIIKINGKNEDVGKVNTIERLVSDKKLSADKIVVEHNLRIVPKEEWPGAVLNDNDNIEIVSFVGGG